MSRKAAIEAFNKNPTLENFKKIAGDADIGVNVGQPSLGEGLKTIQRGDKTFITDADMPTGLPGLSASVLDFFDPSKDRDKKGKLKLNIFAPTNEETIGLKELSESDLTYSPVQKKRLSNALEDIFEEPKTALEQTEEYAESLKALYGDPELRALRRKARREEAIDNQLQYMATEPIRQAFLNRAAEQAAQRGLRIRGALEAMPSNIQNIMTAKQAQRSLASSAFAEEARAAAAQQDAATRFAGLGMQRRFG